MATNFNPALARALLVCAVLFNGANSSGQTITVIAGNGSGPFRGDGGPAISAVLGFPASIAVNSTGDVFIGEEQTGRIRRVTKATGIITTFAGNNVSSQPSGDGGPAFEASIYKAMGLAFDPADNLFIVDGHGGGVLRRVDARTGIITRVNTGLPGVTAIAFDRNGHLLIGYHNQIGRLNSSTGIVTRVAGTGVDPSTYGGDGGPALQAGLGGLTGLAVDGDGNIYYSTGACRVRKISAVTGVISTFAGKPCPDFGGVAPPPGIGDGGPALSATLNPSSLAVDKIGNLYIAETGKRIRRVEIASGFITTFAGNLTSILDTADGTAFNAIVSPQGPGALYFDARDNLFVAEWHVFFDAKARKISGPPLTNATGLWWNANESGWGLNLNQQGNTLFGTLFTYAADGQGLWLVLSNGIRQSNGSYLGDLYQTTGSSFNASPFVPIGPGNLSKVGTMRVTFQHSDRATLTYSVNGITVTKTIDPQVFRRLTDCVNGNSARATATNFQDLWWNPAESGWGLNITHQDETVFATLFTYDSAGRPMWLVLSDGAKQPDGSFSGDLFRTTGPAFNSNPFPPLTAANVAKVGTMRVAFANGERGTLTYTVNGAAVTKSIERQVFGTTPPTCSRALGPS